MQETITLVRIFTSVYVYSQSTERPSELGGDCRVLPPILQDVGNLRHEEDQKVRQSPEEILQSDVKKVKAMTTVVLTMSYRSKSCFGCQYFATRMFSVLAAKVF